MTTDARKQKQLEARRKYRIKNRERIYAQHAAYREANREYFREQSLIYYWVKGGREKKAAKRASDKMRDCAGVQDFQSESLDDVRAELNIDARSGG